jgi:exonuclease V
MDIIASRFGLKTDQPFSDAFIAQISSLNELGFSGATQENVPEQAVAQNDTLAILLQHNSLSALWGLMKQHLRLTFLPDNATAQGSSTPTYLSPLLTATYISASSEPISYIGSRSFFFDPTTLYPYLTDGMQWWHGRRSTKGVPLYEAWKCRICEFRDDCEWRMAKERQFAGRKAAQNENGNGEANVSAKDEASDDKVVKE